MWVPVLGLILLCVSALVVTYQAMTSVEGAPSEGVEAPPSAAPGEADPANGE